MRISSLLASAVFAGVISADNDRDRIIESSSLVPCMKNSNFYASLFRVTFTPKNRTLTYEINGESKVNSMVVLDLQVNAYGYPALRRKIDPCSGDDLKGLCPMTTGSMANMKSNFILDKDTMKQIPGVIYYIPDLDGKVKVWINSTETGKPLACVEAEIRNGKTVHQAAISWTLAVVIGSCLVVSAFMSGFGHFTTAAHVSARAMAVMSYFQAQALIGMMSFSLPPITRAWTQNFQWSMGIIKAQFLESFATWYQRSTGGRPARLFYSLFTTSVHVQKRSNDRGQNPQVEIKTVKGMERVAFLAHIEITNIFFTGYVVFVSVLILAAIAVTLFKGICELSVKQRWMNADRFYEFRTGWTMTLKGVLLRLILIGSLPLVTLCLFELSRKDSSAEVVLAIWILVFVLLILFVAAIKVWRIAKRSQQLHRSAAYILFSNSKLLNKWGFLYIQYKATMTSFLILMLVYTVTKGGFIGLGQKNSDAQVVGLFILELLLLGLVSWLKPYMDKKTNAFNIGIAAVNFVNILILLLISGMVRMPPLGVGILGVIYFLLNTIFTGTIVIMTMWAAIRAILRKNPDRAYPAMTDDRDSFMKSQPSLAPPELDALSKTARGESRMSEYSGMDPRDGGRSNSRNATRRSQDDIESIVGQRERLFGRSKSEK